MTAAISGLVPLVQACGGDDEASTTTSSGDTDLVRADVARTVADPASASVAAHALNAFGAEVHRRFVVDRPDDNLVFSPASIMLALTMTRAGARGQTAAEMDAVLHIAEPEAFFGAVNALTAALDTRSGSFPSMSEEGTGDVELSIANSLWGQHGLRFEEPFLALLAAEFGAGMNLVDYRADPDRARRAINAWVAQATADRIPELLAEGIITVDTVLTLVNAIYLEAQWYQAFDRQSTKPGAFTRPDGSTVTVDMMSTGRMTGYVAGDGWRAVELPYAGQQLAMTMVLPDAGLDEVEQQLGDVWTTVAAGLEATQVSLTMPRWDIETKAELTEMLTALGMPTAFTADADFSGMTADEPLQIGAVVHQANITVNEEGTEAAAATAVVMLATGAPGEPVTVRLDRPFLYAVRDTVTGAVLFQGRVTDPSAAA